MDDGTVVDAGKLCCKGVIVVNPDERDVDDEEELAVVKGEVEETAAVVEGCT